jgi:hypothetical protein
MKSVFEAEPFFSAIVLSAGTGLLLVKETSMVRLANRVKPVAVIFIG